MTKTKTKSEYLETEVELTSEILELLSEFTPEEIRTGLISTGRPAASGSHTFQDLENAYRAAIDEKSVSD